MELIIKENIVPLEVFTNKEKTNAVIQHIKDEVAKFSPDMSTEKGRKAIKSMARKVSSSKAVLINMGKALTADWRSKTDKVNISKNLIEKELNDLRDKVRKPLSDWENKEKERVDKLNQGLEKMLAFETLYNPDNGEEYISSHLKNRITYVEGEYKKYSWDEFSERAIATRDRVITFLKNNIATLEKREKESIELERLRKKEIEQRIKEEKNRVIKEAADKATKEAELKAAKQKKETEDRASQAEARTKQAEYNAAQAKKENILQAKLANEAEEIRKKAAEKKTKEDAEQAKEDIKKASKEATESEQKRAAVEREREALKQRRINDENAQRAANKKHQKDYNREAHVEIMRVIAMSNENETSEHDTALNVLKAIIAGKIPHITIRY